MCVCIYIRVYVYMYVQEFAILGKLGGRLVACRSVCASIRTPTACMVHVCNGNPTMNPNAPMRRKLHHVCTIYCPALGESTTP